MKQMELILGKVVRMVEGMRLWSCCIRERRPMKYRGAVDVVAEKLGVGAAAAGDIQDRDSGLFGLRCKSRGRALNWVVEVSEPRHQGSHRNPVSADG